MPGSPKRTPGTSSAQSKSSVQYRQINSNTIQIFHFETQKLAFS